MTILKEKKKFHMEIPEPVRAILRTLNEAGHEAYIVGGCVRDALMGKEPNDWDVCTSALPEETLYAFAREKTIETGLQHGTVTVMKENQPVEITTYRIDGEYEDGRHPKAVEFTRSLEEDLARRDFTINAMAYHPDKGIVDLYGGCSDLDRGCIRCVGAPRERFREDALRIMRGLRFASTLQFTVDSETAEAMYMEKDGLQNISKERIHTELSKLIMGDNAEQIVTQYMDILETAAEGMQLPEWNINDLPRDTAFRLAALFPEDTARHLYDLRYDNQTVKKAAALARASKEEAPTGNPVLMKRFLRAYGEDIARLHYERAGKLDDLEELLSQEPCYRLLDLNLSGGQLVSEGIEPGQRIGRVLNWLLDEVIEERIPNQKEILLEKAKEKLGYE